ncbi:signal-induced proliferation-associated 1-like protein 2 [Belonocnema kinseyi]|uniref:signal-induced proliferation-associated 1-like protein 2 n=1 Tax=Belonocnema kinseyi TaxID=2817044 RepID=UPI00143D74C9|nr:signal-induced proliferation-associated 1-like protein 2 [Belonocnema kinseyi]XP_033230103.1 signal-induced proliferation-associated 1-like protein 2 [Belonocnema kinseyi]XP_033230104.1 signal-induced proliferation-associated 1-like protein 2 [Belonocnema kinseyi]XP_033230105.1 signal-induced proliferation-associated 1-like protein 2 [Belonocnema kinseyi]
MIASLPVNGGASNGGPMSRVGRGIALHRSNSSLELPHSPDPGSRIPETPLRREYGSHGSIDVVAQSVSVNENLFAMLQDFRPPDQRSPSSSDFLRRVQDPQSPDIDEVCGPTGSSPKLRLKLNRLWGGKPPRGVEEACTSPVISADVEERHRRRAFAHYDCQSFTANLGYAAKLRGLLLARRRNTATGASAASSLRSSTPDEAPEEDSGDGKGNDLLESCPFFRNETGGEGEREVGLTRCPNANGIHRPPMAYGVSVLEPPPGETLWKHTCPLQKRLLPIESVDDGAYYYRRYFLGREHQNWFGMDEQLGPVAISVRKDGTQYRIIVRTTELLTLRGSIPEEALGIRPQGKLPTRELLELVAPEVQLNCLRLGTPTAEPEVANVDEHGLTSRYKIGILYCRAGQRTEEEMYNNQHAGPAFLEFLDTIGQRVRLRGYEGFKAGLDTRTDSTGTHAVVASHRGAEVTFHVSTMLPFTPNNRQQLLRKRHIGNDIVTIVFQEPGALPFSPRRIRSQFQHVFIIVRVLNPCTENTQYTVAISRNKEVPIFGPPVPAGAIFTKGKSFSDFILAKAINGENAAHKVEKFATMATRTRLEYLRNLATKYSSTSVVDTGQKFSMLSFSSKKKAAVRPRLPCDASQRGAICWQVILEDSNQSTDCYLGISVDSIVLVEEHSRQIVFVTPGVSVLGWHAQTNSLRLYYHQGECITIHVRGDCGERDELMEIVARLRAVTQGSPASELSLKRNNLGQLGFHVQPDGVVTQVESMGLAWQAGLRQGSRLVEICKVAVSTLSHDQMVDLLKTSLQVTVTVIPPSNDGNPRRGCPLQNCQYLSGNYEGEYENVTSPDNTPTQQTAMSHQKRYDRSFSPPRSSNSSGYGTGSSSRSFNDPRFPLEGTMTSSSSGHSSADDRWYELLEPQDQDPNHRRDETPPPLPIRQNFQAVTPNKGTPGQKKERESHYSTGKQQFLDSARHHNHDHFVKESNYVSPRVLQESIRQENFQRFENAHRNQEQISQSYVKQQKEKYEVKQENVYASQRDLHKNESQNHQKLAASTSLPLAQNSGYSLAKSGSNNNLIRYNEYDQSNYDNKPDRNSKYDIYEEKCSKHEEEVRHREKRSGYEYDENYERRGSKYEADLLRSDLRHENEPQNSEGKRDDHEYSRENKRYYEVPHEFKVGEKVTCLKTTMSERPVPHKVSIEYRPKDFISSLPPEVRNPDGNATDISTLPSEDELSNGSGSVSPRMRRANKHRGGNLTPSSGGSRNQSPRPKPGARNSHRNSANLTSCSTLQEDLMKLINPDYISDDNQIGNNNFSGNNQNSNKMNNNLLEIQNRCRSRENLCGNSTSTLSVLERNGQENGNNGSEVILTMARPATVISNASTASSPAPSENKMTKEERLSPRVTKTPHTITKPPSTLTAIRDTKLQSENDPDCWPNHIDSSAKNTKHCQDWSDERLIDGNTSSPNSASDLQSHLSTLELRVARETRRRLSLEDEVRRLRDENRRLQDESHAAAQQLRLFTEWFFQNIDHQ